MKNCFLKSALLITRIYIKNHMTYIQIIFKKSIFLKIKNFDIAFYIIEIIKKVLLLK
jgi:hypothetical protein